MFSGRSQDVHFEHKYKTYFCGKIFSFSSPNMCIRYSKVSYFIFLEKRPKNVLKTSQSDTRSVTSLGRPQDVDLIIIHKIGF